MYYIYRQVSIKESMSKGQTFSRALQMGQVFCRSYSCGVIAL